MINSLFKNEYLKNISTIAGGVLLSQIITVGLSPILTRIYSPESFGIYAGFLAMVNILTVIATLRYENALVIVPEDSSAKSLKMFIVLFVFASSLTFFCLIFFFYSDISGFFFGSSYSHWIKWVPLMVFLNGTFYVFRNWLFRSKKFKYVSFGAVYKSVAINSILLLLALFSASPENFLIANIVAQSIETVYLYIKNNGHHRATFKGINFHEGIATLKKYKDFPKYNLTADLVNVYTVQNPVILLSIFFGVSTVGFFSITERVLAIPVKLISTSTLEVYKQKAAEDYSKNGNCKAIFLQTFKYLFFIAIVPTLGIGIASPYLFKLVFGESWIQAGLFAQFLSIKFFFQLTVRPLGFTLLIAGKQLWYLNWQIGLLLVTTLGLLLGYYYQSANLSVLFYSIGYSFMYMIYFLISYKSSFK
jgi:O-antigen/teichoic acid export membrane protein